MKKRLAIFFTLFSCVFSFAYSQTSTPVQIVFIGNSITQGARLAHPETEGPAPQTADILREDGIDVSYVNRGLSGTTTYDWLPAPIGSSHQEGSCFSPLIEATDAFFTPGAEHVFSIMLGTNDSAETTCNGAPVSPEQYDLNMRAIIDTLLARYDDARIVVNYPIWYSPSTYNGAKYLQAGLDRLQTYHPVITQLATAYPNRVFLGDNKAFAAFENHPELFDEEHGNAGNFYLHPNPGGARLLAGFWANSIKSALAQPVADATGYIVRVGQQAPDFCVTQTDGSKFCLSQQRGKVVLLQFTASWCGVCRKEMKQALEPLYQRLKDNPDFMMLGIDRDEPLDTVLGFIKQTGVTYRLALDPGAETYVKYALKESGITRNCLIDREGRIVHLTRLYNEEEFAALVESINNELNK